MPENGQRAATVRVIPWDTLGWAVDIDHGNGKRRGQSVR